MRLLTDELGEYSWGEHSGFGIEDSSCFILDLVQGDNELGACLVDLGCHGGRHSERKYMFRAVCFLIVWCCCLGKSTKFSIEQNLMAINLRFATLGCPHSALVVLEKLFGKLFERQAELTEAQVLRHASPLLWFLLHRDDIFQQLEHFALGLVAGEHETASLQRWWWWCGFLVIIDASFFWGLGPQAVHLILRNMPRLILFISS